MKWIAAIFAATSLAGCVTFDPVPKVTVRFHPEANAQDGSSFARPTKLKNQQREAFISTTPGIDERQIAAVFPFSAADGSWGSTFQLTPQGRMRLETLSTEHRGRALVAFVGTKTGTHQVTDMIIDQPVTNGMITIPNGLSVTEVAVFKKQFKVIGETSRQEKRDAAKLEKARKKDDITKWEIDRTRDGAAKPSGGIVPPLPKEPARPRSGRERLLEQDVPRVGD